MLFVLTPECILQLVRNIACDVKTSRNVAQNFVNARHRIVPLDSTLQSRLSVQVIAYINVLRTSSCAAQYFEAARGGCFCSLDLHRR
jgi:hypothetical protein